MTVGEMLREARGDRSMRQAAGVLGIEASAYRAWEQDFSKPRADKAEALASFLRLSKGEVLGLLGILNPEEVEALRMPPRKPRPKSPRRPEPATVTVPEEKGAYLRGPLSAPILALVA